jgi:hypothetical protein
MAKLENANRFDISDADYFESFDLAPVVSRAVSQANALILENPTAHPLKVFLHAYTTGR